ncbi:hypothetical protein L596_008835 [Steinernema carpocapsae]|uniref:PDZ domain-containing protein n=1 Tax=Steinernema carpocapsae TaxID=34508 RepID=A0A4U5PDM1_STECR|nr:hypothetical protein L596_008835 [Steinernema carpocapsae]
MAATSRGEQVDVTVERFSREDAIVVNENGAVIEKGLVLHGASPQVHVGDQIVAVNGEEFESVEDITQLLTKATNFGKFKLLVNRIKTYNSVESVDRVIIEVRREENQLLGLKVAAEGDYFFVQSVEGVAVASGFKPRDRLVDINGERINTVEDFNKMTENQKTLIFDLRRGGKLPSTTAFEGKQMIIRISYSYGDLLGVNLTKDLVVGKIQPGSLAEDKFEVNDRIIGVNGHKFTEDNQFYRYIQRCDEDLEFEVMRTPTKDGEAAPSATSSNLVLLSLHMTPYEPIGVRPDDKMLITRIQKDSHGEGKFELGDIIKSVNGIPVASRNMFFKLLEGATLNNRVEVIVERCSAREAELEMHRLPLNIEKLIKRSSGFEYILVDIKYVPKAGRIFGLNIAQVTSHKVIVPDVTENSVAAEYLKALDHIVAINGKPVCDVDIAKKIILNCKACFQAVLERPKTLEAINSVKKEVDEWRIKISKPQPHRNMEEMPADVQEIVTNQIARLEKMRKTAPNAKLPSNLCAGGGPTKAKRKGRLRVAFKEDHVETEIQSDVSVGKKLRSIK